MCECVMYVRAHEADYRCLPCLNTTLYLEIGPPSEHRPHCLASLTSKLAPETFNRHFSQWVYKQCYALPVFTWILGDPSSSLTCTVSILPAELSLQF